MKSETGHLAVTHDGRKLRLMTLIDEFTRECLAIRVARRINSFGVLETMADVMLMRSKKSGQVSEVDITSAPCAVKRAIEVVV